MRPVYFANDAGAGDTTPTEPEPIIDDAVTKDPGGVARALIQGLRYLINTAALEVGAAGLEPATEGL